MATAKLDCVLVVGRSTNSGQLETVGAAKAETWNAATWSLSLSFKLGQSEHRPHIHHTCETARAAGRQGTKAPAYWGLGSGRRCPITSSRQAKR